MRWSEAGERQECGGQSWVGPLMKEMRERKHTFTWIFIEV